MRTRITEPPQDSRVVKGSTIEMKCGVAHDAAVTVNWVWYHNDARIPPEDERRTVQPDGTIEIRSVRSDDIGNYRCMVHSVAGNDTQDADMQVIGKATKAHPFSKSAGAVFCYYLNAKLNYSYVFSVILFGGFTYTSVANSYRPVA